MDRITIFDRIRHAVIKYKYAALILALGILLMSFPDNKNTPEKPEQIQSETKETSLSESLEEILAKMDGVGRVSVLLTEARGGETIYQVDEDRNTSENTNSVRLETVLISDELRTENGLIRQMIPPSYRGAIVVCQGADRPSVKLAIVNAVANVTGISADRITVLKMK